MKVTIKVPERKGDAICLALKEMCRMKAEINKPERIKNASDLDKAAICYEIGNLCKDAYNAIWTDKYGECPYTNKQIITLAKLSYRIEYCIGNTFDADDDIIRSVEVLEKELDLTVNDRHNLLDSYNIPHVYISAFGVEPMVFMDTSSIEKYLGLLCNLEDDRHAE